MTTIQEEKQRLFNMALAVLEAQETYQILSTDINPALMENVQKAVYDALRSG